MGRSGRCEGQVEDLPLSAEGSKLEDLEVGMDKAWVWIR